MANPNNPYADLLPETPESADNPYADLMPNAPLPKAENLLQQAIRNSRIGSFGGTSITAALPASGEEAMDLTKVIDRQIPMTRGQAVGPIEMGPVGIGLNMAGIKEADPIIPPPQTEYGRNLEASADIASWAALGLGGLTAGAKSLHRFFSKGNLPKEVAHVTGQIAKSEESMNRLEKLISKGKGARKKLRTLNIREGQRVAFEGEEELTKKSNELFESALKNYKEKLSSIDPSNISTEDFVQAIDRTLESKGATSANYLSPQELALKNIRDRLINSAEYIDELPEIIDPVTNGVIQQASPAKIKFKPLTRASELKYFQDEIYRATSGRKDLQGEFLKHFGNMAEAKGASGLTEANAAYRKAYQIVDDISSINRPALKRTALGSPHISTEEISKMASSESGLGTNVLERTKMQGQKALQRQNKLESYIERSARKKATEEAEIAALKTKKDLLQQTLDRKNFRRKVTGGLALTGAGGAVGYAGTRFMKGIFDLLNSSS